jgi:Cyclic nucleotide-binding domain.
MGKIDIFIKVPRAEPIEGEPPFELRRVATKGTGDSFGELALFEDIPKPRAATIITKTDCHFARLNKKPYNELVGKFQKLDIGSKADFLSQLAIFKPWSAFNLKSWVYMFDKKEIFKRKDVLYKEGDSPDYVYIVRSGEVTCTKTITIQRKEEDSEHVFIDETNQICVTKKSSIQKSVNIAVLGSGHMFGEEEAWQAYKIEKEFERERERARWMRRDFVTEQSESTAREEEPKKIARKNKDIPPNLPTRQMTVTVTSGEAEIWYLNKKV